MNPIAFNIFGLSVAWYGIFIAIGMMVGILLADFTSRLKRGPANISLNHTNSN